MIARQAPVVQAPRSHSPFGGILGSLFSVLSPFIPGAPVVQGALGAGATLASGGSPFKAAQQFGGGIASQIGGDSGPAASAAQDAWGGAKDDQQEQQPGQAEKANDSQGQGQQAPAEAPQAPDQQNPYSEQQLAAQQGTIQNLAEQYPDAFAYLAQNPHILQGGHNFLDQLQAYGMMKNRMTQNQNQQGGVG